MGKLVFQVTDELLQLAVMLWRNALEHEKEQTDDFKVILDFLLP